MTRRGELGGYRVTPVEYYAEPGRRIAVGKGEERQEYRKRTRRKDF
jgi:hypothetical protein